MKSICKQSFLYSLATGIYIILVATFMTHANSILGKVDGIVSGTAMLLLFTMSALVVGGLLAGKPIFLYIDGKKKEAVKMLLASAGWLLFFFAITILILLVWK